MPKPFFISDPEGRNAHRVHWAERTLNLFGLTQDTRYVLTQSPEVQLSDLLTNFAHFCDAHGIRMHEAIRRAQQQYRAETEGEGRQFERIRLR